MAQDAAIIARLGLDTDGFKKGLAAAAAAKGDFARVAAQGNDKLLESEKRVESQLGGLVERLKGVRSAGEAATTVIEAFAESINLNLGTAVGVAAVIGFVRVLSNIRDEAEKARVELDALMQPRGNPDFSSLSALESRLAGLKKNVEEMSRDKGLWGSLGEMLSESALLGGEGGSFTEVGERIHARALAALKEIAAVREDIAEKAADQTRLMEMEANGLETAAKLEKVRLEYAEKIAAAISAQNVGLQEQLQKQKEITEAVIITEGARKDDDAVRKMQEDMNKKQAGVDAVAEAERRAIDENAARQRRWDQRGEEETDRMRAEDQKDAEKAAAKLHQKQKQNAENLLESRIKAEQTLGAIEIANAQAAAAARADDKANFVADKMAGPGAELQRERDDRKAERLGERFDRQEALKNKEARRLEDANHPRDMNVELMPKAERDRHNRMLERPDPHGGGRGEKETGSKEIVGKLEEIKTVLDKKLGTNL